ncbi:uncharacterized protein BT62DRAFT_1010131 [Guyanagaster necrorhizus]|uniref:GDP/GTP exchange factor Sec2 N-terminal domain-containing protein n=1 Tax=Guyanagaster necrorhizus TaxID=856835 RepID=A0A9P7VMC5_9AGAR|nr:uncharacterized protein BT62DRAFT_1010131 [Guyanagaster necrorhizus MCA 3950]KAG7442544.1 hypothetical protein BT62DRAFT_1010131 [Guyanagaster necrorhizus MCA 3950]
MNGGTNATNRRLDGLNATQQKSSSDPLFLAIEEELHDTRRVHADGQEDDLRLALSMVITRVTELSTLLSEAYKTQADLEVQLNVTKSNLKLVIANNEMLEEALKQGHANDIGWRRSSSSDHRQKSQSIDIVPENGVAMKSLSSSPSLPSLAGTPPPPPPPPQQQDSRFFYKFRFTSSSSASRASSRPGTPNLGHGPSSPNPTLTSPSMPSLPVMASVNASKDKEMEELMASLEKERVAHKVVVREKAALEAELESLSQALFEEANKMVATERIKLAETEEELREARQEKEALKSALRVVEGENVHLRGSSSSFRTPDPSMENLALSETRSRSSSEVGVKSRPASASSLSSPSVSRETFSPVLTAEIGPAAAGDGEELAEENPTPQHRSTVPSPSLIESSSLSQWAEERMIRYPDKEEEAEETLRQRKPSPPWDEGSSPWADVPSSDTRTRLSTSSPLLPISPH